VNNSYSIEDDSVVMRMMMIMITMDVELSRPVNRVVMGTALFSAI